MRIAIFIIVLLLTTAFIQRLIPSVDSLPGAEVVLMLGFVLLAAYLLGKSVTRFRLPKISGYLLAGIVLGPYFLNYLSTSTVGELKLIDDIALSLIALTAGGEFRLSNVRKKWRLLSSVISWQIVIVLCGVTTGVLLLSPWLGFLNEHPLRVVLGMGLIFGSLAIAKSPATTIAIITESKARGPLTDLVLEVTVAKDIIVVLVFAVILAFAKPLVLPGHEMQLQYVFSVLGEITLSLLVGGVAGYLIYSYMKYVKQQTFIFLMGFVLLIIEVSRLAHLEIVLVFMMAGFMIQNFSKHGDDLIHAIESNSLPVYVTFFTIAGASLNFDLFIKNWVFTLLIVGLRLGTTQIGTWVGSRFTTENTYIRRYAWMGFIGQAGVTLGLAIIVGRTLPGEIGSFIKTIMIAAIAINQLLGPVLFRFALDKAGEISTAVPKPAVVLSTAPKK